ncbi:DctP family TRAP transporter solute-binding subunit [Pontibacillus salicampi]|uniref:DctP family TRAP transporter solute-binding subunit n=1 Tax=Pontibacillus salicampi TaxID=1449801 RepID=A0ABV6LQA9_9BACI
MKKTIGVWCLALLLLGLAACSNDSSGEAKTSKDSYEIRVAHLVNEKQSTHVALEDFKKAVEERTDGKVSVTLYPNGSLYASDREAIEAVQLGNLEMTVPAVAPLANFNSKFMVFDLPFLFDSRDAAHSALDGELGQQLLTELEQNDLKGLVFGENGFRNMSNNEAPIEEPSDLDGLKFRTMSNPVHTASFNAWGANASPLAFGELYTALQQGTYDAMESPISLYYTQKFYEVQDYLTKTGHFYAATVMLTNNDYFNNLPEDIQSVIQEEAENWRANQREIAAKQDAEWLKSLQDEGMKVNELSDEQKQVFMEESQSVYDKFSDEIGQNLIDMAKDAN